MASGSNKVTLDVLIRAKAETAQIRKAKTAIKGMGAATKRAGKDMHHFRIVTADTQRRIGALRNVLLLLKFAMATMGIRMLMRQFGSWLKSWAEQEQAVNRLNASLAGVGRYTEQTSKAYQKMAADMQKASVYGDEAIMEVMQTLMTLGKVADKDLKKATQSVLDFAAATGRDLTMATLLVTKAAVGYTGELSRYGIVIDQGLSKTEKFAATLEFLATMKGRAEAETYTLKGAVTQLGNSYGDAREKVGKMITESTNLVPALKLMNEWIVIVASNTAASGEIMLDLGNTFIWLLRALNMTTLYIKAFGNTMQIMWAGFKVIPLDIILVGQAMLKAITFPLKLMEQAYDATIRFIALKFKGFANYLAGIDMPIPGKGKLITGLNAMAKGISNLQGISNGVFTALDSGLNQALKDTYKVLEDLKPEVKGHLEDLMGAGASYNKMSDEIDILISKYPELKANLEKLKAQILKNKDIKDAAKNAKSWQEALYGTKATGAATKYYTQTRAESRKLREEEVNNWAAASYSIAEAAGKLKEYEAILARMRKETVVKNPISFGDSMTAGLANTLDKFKTFAQEVESVFSGLAKTLESTMSSVIVDAWNADLKTSYDYYVAFRKSMYKIGADFIAAEIKAIMVGQRKKEIIERAGSLKDMALKIKDFLFGETLETAKTTSKIAGEAKRTAVTAAGEGARTTVVVAGEAKQAVAVATASTTKITANAAEETSAWSAAIASFIKAHAWVPYVGVALAGAAIGGAVALMASNRNMFAKGGIVTGRTDATIGEAGPEAVIPLTRGPSGKLGIANYGGGGGDNGGTIVENHYYINAVDSKSFADLVDSNPSSISNVIGRNIKGNRGLRNTIGAYT